MPAEMHTHKEDIITILMCVRKGPTVDGLAKPPEWRLQNAAETRIKAQVKRNKRLSIIDLNLSSQNQGRSFVMLPIPIAWQHPSNNFISKHKSPETTWSTEIQPDDFHSTCKNSLIWHNAQISLSGPVLRVKSSARCSPGLTGTEIQLKYNKTHRRSQTQMPTGTMKWEGWSQGTGANKETHAIQGGSCASVSPKYCYLASFLNF